MILNERPERVMIPQQIPFVKPSCFSKYSLAFIQILKAEAGEVNIFRNLLQMISESAQSV